MDAPHVRRLPADMTRRNLILWAATLAIGGLLGYRMAEYSLQGGFQPLGAVFLGFIALSAVAILLFAALVLASRDEKRGRRAARATAATAIALAAGVGLGWTLGPPLGLAEKYHNAITLGADGTLTVTLDDIDGFAAIADSPAECKSVPDGEGVTTVGAYLVGHVDTIEVAASVVDLGRDAPYLWVYVNDGARSQVLVWKGPFEVIETTAGDQSAEVTFSDAPLDPNETPGAVIGPWPETLSGTMRWSCNEWTRL